MRSAMATTKQEQRLSDAVKRLNRELVSACSGEESGPTLRRCHVNDQHGIAAIVAIAPDSSIGLKAQILAAEVLLRLVPSSDAARAGFSRVSRQMLAYAHEHATDFCNAMLGVASGPNSLCLAQQELLEPIYARLRAVDAERKILEGVNTGASAPAHGIDLNTLRSLRLSYETPDTVLAKINTELASRESFPKVRRAWACLVRTLSGRELEAR